MTTFYTISDTFLVAYDSRITPSPFWIFRDKPYRRNKKDKRDELEKLFADSYKVFRVRVRDLGRIDQPTTDNEADALRVMMEGLLTAKKKLSE